MTPERAASDLPAPRREPRADAVGPARERILVCIGPSPASERLVRAAHRIATGMRAPWLAVHVDIVGAPPLSAEDRDRVEGHIALAESLGGEVARLSGRSVAQAVLELARERDVTRIVAGKPTHSRWRDRVRGSLLDALIRGSGDLEIHVIAPGDDPPRRSPAIARGTGKRLAMFVPGLAAVHIDLAADIGAEVDPILSEQLLINLLENAAKHTPARTPIEIRGGHEAGGVAIEISDRGPGLPAGPEDQVFQKFFRGPETGAARAARAGLGLAVCRGIANAHGGTIDARRRPDGGATFHVWLPGGDAPAGPARPPLPAIETTST